MNAVADLQKAGQDGPWMVQALALARSAGTLPAPNPSIGCVLVSPAGQLIGQGHTQLAGGPHAERVALGDALARGHATQGATAYVTLEPCCHHGRTGPCCDALIAAGVQRVVAAMADPNPLVAGQGFARLHAAGVQVEIGLGATDAAQINLGFFSRMLRKTPWVRMKVAASLDGKTALDNGQSQWITGPAARADGHAWRARACVVLTGIGTVLEDDPRLDVRLTALIDQPADQSTDQPAHPSDHAPGTTPTRQPKLVVIDSRLQTPLTAKLWAPKRELLIYCALDGPDQAAQKAALQTQGATVVCLPGQGAARHDKVDLQAVLHDLAGREVNEVHVEAGEKLNGSFLREGLVDELLLYLAPKLLGPGRGMANLEPLARLDLATELKFKSVETVGQDLRIVARLAGREDFLNVY